MKRVGVWRHCFAAIIPPVVGLSNLRPHMWWGTYVLSWLSELREASLLDITGRRLWQVAAGDLSRHYPDICLDWDVILNGPSDGGSWPETEGQLEKDIGRHKWLDLRRFCEEIQPGDIVVLRMGTTEVYGVGEVVGPYLWDDDFGDIDGWDIQHVRRVRWLWVCDGNPKLFPTYALKWGDTTQELTSEEVIAWVKELDVPSSAFARSLKTLPKKQEGWRNPTLRPSVVGEFLFDQGIASDSIDRLLSSMDELVRIAQWYNRSAPPSEHETVAYLVVPLLRSLGWTPQRMAIEWRHIDIALFSRMPRQDSNLVAALEAKQRGMACLSARSQAQSYATGEGRENCNRLVVTDGIRFGVYVRDGSGGFSGHPYAYLNLTRMLDSYPIIGSKGAKEALLVMAADWDGTLV